ncbi:hypothetical protein H4R34_000418 [Dimargaris verticillata]|uniref:Calcipressin-domain-containing protein n=1 Tax=Dimargaris verticillata TaxID=2761393 RepID=A0A9W8BCN3_9FUNG|nr:hypothetical protein H4R34_000418 [Dimargaris verticillata]
MPSSQTGAEAAGQPSTSAAAETAPFPTPALIFTLDPFDTDVAHTLHQLLTAHYAPVLHFATLRSFSRCLVVLDSRDKATRARQFINHERWNLKPQVCVRAYFYQIDPNDLDLSNTKFLALPENEKLWLISPPGSPPVGWEQSREDPPNAAHLTKELHSKLQDLGNGKFHLKYDDSGDEHHEDYCPSSPTAAPSINLNSPDQGKSKVLHHSAPRKETLGTDTSSLSPSLSSAFGGSKLPIPLPSRSRTFDRPAILIEAWDDSDDPDHADSPATLPRTAMPKAKMPQ